MKKNILIGITGGISAYKILDLIRILKKDNFNIKVIMTYSAQKIMPASAIKKLGIEVHNDMFGKNFNYKKIIKNQRIDHIDLGRFADLVIVAPATANIIAKLAGGFADDLLTATLLATIKPVFIYPSMNTNMWLHPSVQKNIRILSQLNYHIINPESGKLACDSVGIGRLPEVKDIYQDIKDHLNDSSRLKGKKIIVTAGPTIEYIDPVRIITNKSSGRMGLMIAEVCHMLEAEVLLIRAKSAVKSRYPITEMTFESARELENLIKQTVKESDMIFHTAAVSDFKTGQTYPYKLDSKRKYTMSLIPQNKIINMIKKINPKIYLTAFKAAYNLTDEKMIMCGKQLLNDSDADAVAVNDLARPNVGFEVDTNEIILIRKNMPAKKIGLESKINIARKLVTSIMENV